MPQNETTNSPPVWEGKVIEADTGACCFICGGEVRGTDYVWRGRCPLLGDFRVEYVHPKCADGVERNHLMAELVNGR